MKAGKHWSRCERPAGNYQDRANHAALALAIHSMMTAGVIETENCAINARRAASMLIETRARGFRPQYEFIAKALFEALVDSGMRPVDAMQYTSYIAADIAADGG